VLGVALGAGCSESTRYPSSTRGAAVVSRAGAPVDANAGHAIKLPVLSDEDTSCDPYAVRPLGVYWVPFTDEGCGSDDTTSVVRAQWNDATPRVCEATWAARVPKDSGSFTGIESEVLMDLSEVARVRFEVRGKGQPVRAQFADRNQLVEGLRGSND
jgi:hypothetical protein